MVAPIVVASVMELGKQLIDQIFPDKIKQETERAKAELALAQLAQEGRLKEMGQQLSAIIAEATSTDPWTSRARPSFLYVMYVIILWSIPMGIISAFRPELATAISAGMTAYLKAIPDSLWALFGTGYLGYTAARSWQNRKK